MILAFMQSTLTAQEFTNKVAGRVMEEKTGRPIADVNVYISETTIGTSTDKDGYYTISKVPSGTHELVASKIGFQSNFKTFTVDKNEEVELTFYLKETVYELEQVKVKDARPDKWISKLEFFKSTLLGNSPFTDDCKFENPEIIEFSGSPAGKLDATAPKPLIITNNALGYKLEILLKSYIWKGNEQRIQYKIQPKFQDITPESKQEYQTWVKNRQEAYEGSIDHLLNSLIENNYKKEGFRIYISILPKKHQKVSQREEIHSAEKILRRFADTKNYVLHFQNFLQVEYGNETSWLKLLYPNVLIDEYGQPHDPVPFERHGAWAESGLSEMLPKYWDTNQEKLDKP
jgi:hypothetical protein